MFTRLGSSTKCVFISAGLAVLFLAIGARSADAQVNPGFYIGAGLSALDFNDENDGIGYGGSSAGWQAYGGYRFNKLLAVEVGAKQYGEIDSGEIAGSGTTRQTITADFEALVVRGMFSVSLEDLTRRNSNIDLFGTAGYFDAETRRTIQLLNASQSTGVVTFYESGLALGGGILYRFPRVVLRGSLEWFDGADDRNPLELSVAIEYRFR